MTLKLDERALPAEEFEHVSARAGLIAERRVKREEALENFGKPGRDEVAFGSLFAGIAKRAGWVPHMKLAQLRHDWASIVGDVIARNTWVGAIDNGVLTIHAKSPSWTTQLTFMLPELREKVLERLNGLDIRDIRVTGPQAHGPATRRKQYVRQNMHYRPQ
ncbi:conserved hypothetical protein [Bifidobacterium animalis subsp. lactis CECT 8145]|nr:Zn-ribbon-containing, RNA-binding like protein [Bifidobacterium animalis subsp. lactis B420]AFJ17326.1 Zn-ribbon-containing, possibly RNA-binding protein [Bifidobacterium animalis subsp. lactis Bi-07]CDL72379.1 conserved hypothetical protein [Bifidobacterium animalis subsp. lactis CECT 8145]